MKLRAGRDADGGRSSSGNWSGTSSTRASLDCEQQTASSSNNNNNSFNLSPPTVRHRLVRPVDPCDSLSDFDSALSDCSQSITYRSEHHHPQSHLTHTNHTHGGGGGGRVESGSEGGQEDVDTGSVYSCDAEGYYTSFHIDSGLKTLREGHSDASLNLSNVLASGASRLSSVSNNNNSSSNSNNHNNSGSVAENEYELFGRGSTSTTTSSAGTVIYRESAAAAVAVVAVVVEKRKKSSTPPEPPPRNRDSVLTVINLHDTALDDEKKVATTTTVTADNGLLSAAESNEIEAALNDLRSSGSDRTIDVTEPESETESDERFKHKTQISAVPSMCVVTPPPSDDESVRSSTSTSVSLESHIQAAFLQHVVAVPSTVPTPKPQQQQQQQQTTAPRVNLMDCPPQAIHCDAQIVIKASVVKGGVNGMLHAEGGLVSLNELPPSLEPNVGGGGGNSNGNETAASSSCESSRSSSLERKRRQGARVTLDSQGKVVYSSDSLRRSRKPTGAQTTFEPGPHVRTDPPAVLSPPHQHQYQQQQQLMRMEPIGISRSPEAPRKMATVLPPPNWTISPQQQQQQLKQQPPPYRMAPSFARTQPDGDADARSSSASPASNSSSSNAAILLSRSDSYKLANDEVGAGATT